MSVFPLRQTYYSCLKRIRMDVFQSPQYRSGGLSDFSSTVSLLAVHHAGAPVSFWCPQQCGNITATELAKPTSQFVRNETQTSILIQQQ